jgi:hypothetical protein
MQQQSLFTPPPPKEIKSEVKKITAKAALCRALLEGKTINIKNCFNTIGLTNAPREVSRMVEQPFSVKLDRKRMEGHSKYGQSVCWVNYTLPFTEENKEGIEKMKEYINQ